MLLTRLLISCLSVWLIDQCLAKFGVENGPKVPWKSVIQIVVIIVAVLFVLFGWYLELKLA